jgi:hypothetical protein
LFFLTKFIHVCVFFSKWSRKRAAGCVPEAMRVEKRIKDAGGMVADKCDKNFGATSRHGVFVFCSVLNFIVIIVVVVLGIDASLCDIAARVVYNPQSPDFTSPQTIAATASVCSPYARLFSVAESLFLFYLRTAPLVAPMIAVLLRSWRSMCRS